MVVVVAVVDLVVVVDIVVVFTGKKYLTGGLSPVLTDLYNAVQCFIRLSTFLGLLSSFTALLAESVLL